MTRVITDKMSCSSSVNYIQFQYQFDAIINIVWLVYLQTLSERFYPHTEIETDAILSLDEDALLQSDEVGYIIGNIFCGSN